MKLPNLETTDILYRDVEERIDSIRGKKRLYLALHRATRIIIFFCGAAITIATGWQTNEFAVRKDAILIISATISLLTAVEGLFNFKDKGKSNDLLLFELRRLRDRICFAYTENAELCEEKKSDYFAEYQIILNSTKALIQNSGNDEE